jgi:hypothetical protein
LISILRLGKQTTIIETQYSAAAQRSSHFVSNSKRGRWES